MDEQQAGVGWKVKCISENIFVHPALGALENQILIVNHGLCPAILVFSEDGDDRSYMALNVHFQCFLL